MFTNPEPGYGRSMPADFTIDVSRTDAEAVVTPVGEIDGSTVPQLIGAVDSLLRDMPTRIVLDLGGVTFCDSQGLGTLVTLTNKVRLAQSALVIVNASGYLNRVLDVTGLRQVLLIEP
jgi:anti-sigma B factor antagonist